MLLVTFPLMAFIMLRTVKYQKVRLKHMDERVKLTNEVLQGIRVVKYYAWEVRVPQNTTRHRSAHIAHEFHSTW